MNEHDYTCPICKTTWELIEVSDEMWEKEGCPDCLHECERCGEFIDSDGFIEHCL